MAADLDTMGYWAGVRYVSHDAIYWLLRRAFRDRAGVVVLDLIRFRDTSDGVVVPAASCERAEPHQVAAIDWWRGREKWW